MQLVLWCPASPVRRAVVIEPPVQRNRPRPPRRQVHRLHDMDRVRGFARLRASPLPAEPAEILALDNAKLSSVVPAVHRVIGVLQTRQGRDVARFPLEVVGVIHHSGQEIRAGSLLPLAIHFHLITEQPALRPALRSTMRVHPSRHHPWLARTTWVACRHDLRVEVMPRRRAARHDRLKVELLILDLRQLFDNDPDEPLPLQRPDRIQVIKVPKIPSRPAWEHHPHGRHRALCTHWFDQHLEPAEPIVQILRGLADHEERVVPRIHIRHVHTRRRQRLQLLIHPHPVVGLLAPAPLRQIPPKDEPEGAFALAAALPAATQYLICVTTQREGMGAWITVTGDVLEVVEVLLPRLIDVIASAPDLLPSELNSLKPIELPGRLRQFGARRGYAYPDTRFRGLVQAGSGHLRGTGSGGGTRTHALRIMSPPRCLCATPHQRLVTRLSASAPSAPQYSPQRGDSGSSAAWPYCHRASRSPGAPRHGGPPTTHETGSRLSASTRLGLRPHTSGLAFRRYSPTRRRRSRSGRSAAYVSWGDWA